ncbi:hypothetical protein [Haloferax sp. YSSS75]|uniref:hypothetical protein n=1 Tax=Haloferax sp. YSSS75 TaxID=3388564 RepID=UPI00398D2B34
MDSYMGGWKSLLLAMYRGTMHYTLDENDLAEINPEILDETGMDEDDFVDAFDYLKENSLVELKDEFVHEGIEGYVLSQLGVQIAHELSVQQREADAKRRQESINRAIMLAASVTAITSILTSWPPQGPVFQPFLQSQVIEALARFFNPAVTILLLFIGAFLLVALIHETKRLYRTP